MKFLKLTAAYIFFGMLSFTSSSAYAYYFEDGFETGDNSGTSSDGFFWGGGGGGKVKIANSSCDVYSIGSNSAINPPDCGSSNYLAPQSGNYSMHFPYLAGDSFVEQRFTMFPRKDKSGLKDLWVRFWLRVPESFKHINKSPNNQKLMALWMDGYSAQGEGSSVWLGYFYDKNRNDGSSTVASTHSTGNKTVSKGFGSKRSFIKVPEDRGKWMQIVWHIKTESSSGASNGVLEMWRRWENESNFTHFETRTGMPIKVPSSGPNGFRRGYLLGHANSPYAVDTHFQIDDFTISSQSLLDGGVSKDISNVLADPLPPSGLN